MFVYDPADVSGNGGNKFAWSYLPVVFTNGPVGETSYTDDTWGFGINYTTGGSSRMDATKPSLGITFESRYFGSTVFGSEFHVQGYDLGGVNHRPFSVFFPHDNASTAAGVQVQANYFDVLNWNDQSTMLHLVHPGAASFGGLMMTVTAPQLADNNTVLAVRGPAAELNGNVNAIHAQISAAYNVASKIINLSTGANATAVATVETNGGGDAALQFAVSSGATSWIVGCDNSDSDKFKISNHWAFGTNDRVMIDANTVAFALPAKLPGFTVAGVPSASTAGAGAMIYVSNETGGAVPAFSDGTNWRRVTDRAVIS